MTPIQKKALYAIYVGGYASAYSFTKATLGRLEKDGLLASKVDLLGNRSWNITHKGMAVIAEMKLEQKMRKA